MIKEIDSHYGVRTREDLLTERSTRPEPCSQCGDHEVLIQYSGDGVTVVCLTCGHPRRGKPRLPVDPGDVDALRQLLEGKPATQKDGPRRRDRRDPTPRVAAAILELDADQFTSGELSISGKSPRISGLNTLRRLGLISRSEKRVHVTTGERGTGYIYTVRDREALAKLAAER